jgi:hypothetical protein
MTYERDMVICAYRALHPDDLALPENKIEEFDQTLNNRFDAEMRRQAQMPQNNISTSELHLSRLVFFSAMSTEATVEAQVEEGCEFYLSVYGSGT